MIRSGLRTTTAGIPPAVSLAARIAPVAGHGPSGIGKMASRPVAIRRAPPRTATAAARSSR